jgi:MATE family multidrug resistance protein
MEHPAPSFRSLFTLAWPIIVSRSTQVVVGLADAIMVAHLGETVLAAALAGRGVRVVDGVLAVR